MTLTEKFNRYLHKNPHVYTLFVQFTNEAISSGKAKFSAWLVVNRIRWESSIVIHSNEQFKISNDYVALLARKFMIDYPQHSDIFNIKMMSRA